MILSHQPQNKEKNEIFTFYRTFRADWIQRYTHLFDHAYQGQEYFDLEWENFISEEEKAQISRLYKAGKYQKAQQLKVITREPNTKKYYEHMDKVIREHIRKMQTKKQQSRRQRQRIKKQQAVRKRSEESIQAQQPIEQAPFVEDQVIVQPRITMTNRQDDDDQQQIEDASQPTQIEVTDYLPHRISKKTKTAKVYHCKYCHYKHHEKKRVLKHKNKCLERIKTKKATPKDSQSKIGFNEIVFSPEIPERKSNIAEENEINELKNEIMRLKKQNNQLKGSEVLFSHSQEKFYCNKMASNIIEQIKVEIIKLLKIQLTCSLQKASSGGAKISQMQATIMKNLMSYFATCSFDSLISESNYSLKEAHTKIQQYNCQKGNRKRTHEGDELAKKFLMKYTELDFTYQSRIIKDLTQATEWVQDNVQRYYRKLRKLSKFSIYPEIPRLNHFLPWKSLGKMLNTQVIAEYVQQLLKKGQGELASDIWMISCMGLDAKELKLLEFATQYGEPFSMIKVFQHRTKKSTVRFIPKSLIKLIFHTNTRYPISQQRLKAAKHYLTTNVKKYYSLRHNVSVNLITALTKTTIFNNFPPAQQQVFKIRLQCEAILDQIYRLQLDNFINRRVYILAQLSENSKDYKEVQSAFASLDSNEIILEGYEFDKFYCDIYQLLAEKSKKQFQQKEMLVAKSMIFHNYCQQLSEDASQTRLTELLARISYSMSDFDFHEELSRELAIDGTLVNKKGILQIAANLLHRRIILWSKQELNEYAPLPVNLVEPQLQPLIIAEVNNRFYPTQQEEILITQRIPIERTAKLRATTNIKNLSHENRLIRFGLKCSLCKKSNYVVQPDRNKLGRGHLICQGCNHLVQQIHQQHIKFKPSSAVKIICEYSDKIEVEHLSAESWLKNNLRQKVQERYGKGKYYTHSRYTCDIPSVIYTPFCSFSKKMIRQIQKNRYEEEFLPIKIQKSTVENAGEGLFAVMDIPKNRMVITYVGVIGSTFTLNLFHNCNFHVGWLHSAIPRELMISSQFGSNAGRYMNCSSPDYPANCKVKIGVINENEIAIYFYTIKHVFQGQQLFFDYGPLYSDKFLETKVNQQDIFDSN